MSTANRLQTKNPLTDDHGVLSGIRTGLDVSKLRPHLLPRFGFYRHLPVQ